MRHRLHRLERGVYRLGKRLRRHEFIFGVLGSLAVSLIGIYVAWSAKTIYQQQATLLAQQTELLNRDHQPLFDFTVERIDVAGHQLGYEALIVKNDGATVLGFSAQAKDFLVVDYRYDTLHQGQVYVPLDSYYDIGIPQSHFKGEMYRKYGALPPQPSNLEVEDKLRTDFVALSSQDHAAFFSEATLVHITYRDILDVSHDEYYEVPRSGRFSALSQVDGKARFNSWNDRALKGDVVKLSTATARDVYTVFYRMVGITSSPPA